MEEYAFIQEFHENFLEKQQKKLKEDKLNKKQTINSMKEFIEKNCHHKNPDKK